MAPPLHPLPRLKQLMRERDAKVSTLARVIGRSESYLRRRLTAETYLLDLPVDEIAKLAAFFGVSAREFGG